MKIDPTEIEQLIERTGVRRTQLYTAIHKALRARMAALLCRVGEVDADDDTHCREVVRDLVELLDALLGHLETEERYVHPAIEARRPGALDATIADHAAQQGAIGELRRNAQTLLHTSGEQRAARALFLYRELALFVADNLTHMHDEETTNHALLWSAYTDAELEAIHATILAALPPEKMAVLLPWIISALSPAERGQMFREMRAAAPATVFEATLGLARSCLASREWEKLCAALGFARSPDLAGLAAA